MTELAEIHLREESAQLETLLAEVHERVDPAAWLRVERIVRNVMALHRAVLVRLIDHAQAAGAERGKLDAALAADELVASLLALHGCHPLPAQTRIDRVLADVRRQLGLADGELVATISSGVAHVRAGTELGGGDMSPRVAESVIRHAIEAAAPELTAIEIVGLPLPRDPSLVQLRPRREGHP